jgi:phosphoribosylglycinamide formyltransferase-1
VSLPRLAILISGRGRNAGALIDAVRDGRIPAEMAAIISNRADAAGLDTAHAAGIEPIVVPHIEFPSRAAFDAALAARLRACSPDIVALAGFMRVLGDDFVREFEGRMLNIHPSLLPKYPGLNTHQRALDARELEHGATVHYVTSQLDGGPPAIQGRLSVKPEDDAARLAQRVLEEVELKIYPQAVAWMARGDLKLQDGVVRFRGAQLAQPLTLSNVEDVFNAAHRAGGA